MSLLRCMLLRCGISVEFLGVILVCSDVIMYCSVSDAYILGSISLAVIST